MENKLFQIGIKGIIVKENKALILKISKKSDFNKYWDVPGGRINKGETYKDTLIRELKEELPGINDIEIGNLVYTNFLPHDLNNGYGLLLMFYKVKADVSNISLSFEHTDLLWTTAEELMKNDQIGDVYRDAVLKTL